MEKLFSKSRLRSPRTLTREIRWKIHSFALGMTLAVAAPLVAQGCVAGGQ